VDPPPVDPPPVDPPPVDPPPVDTTATITWTQVAPLPVPRSEHMGAAVNGKLYVFGGYVDLTFKPTRRSDVYDPATNAWTRVADLPVGVTHSGTVVDATTSSVYFAGGYPETATFQRYATAAVYRYDTAANAFTALPSLPAARGGGALALLGRELHYFGGSDANRADAADHWALDLDNAAAGWSARARLPVARNHVGGVAVGGKLYAVGGQQGQNDDSVFRSELDVYDPATNAWTTLAPLPNPPRSHITNGTMVWNGQILTFGGETNGHQVITNVSSYNPATNTWTTPSNLPAGRLSGVADLLSPNTVIFAGGSSSTGLQSTVWLGQIT
jgi:N-acetylneuraminic acid mutarotase